MRDIRDIKDANQALKDLNDKLDAQRTQEWDLHGRKIKNVGPSENDYDVVVRRELIDEKGRLDQFITRTDKHFQDIEKLIRDLTARVVVLETKVAALNVAVFGA